MAGQVVYLSEVAPERDAGLFADQPDVLGIPEVAGLLGVNAQTVRREIARGRLGCIHVGRRVKVTKRQLVRYVEEAASDA